jgi:cholesterol 7alpha-monooxygenase
LNFDTHLARLLRNFGVKAAAFKKAWHKPEPGDWCYIPNNPINPGQLDLIHLVEETFKKQLLPGKHMDSLSQAFMDSLYTTFHWDNLDACLNYKYPSCVWCGEHCTHGQLRYVSLYSLSRFFIVEATTRSLFGNSMHEVEPDIVQIISEFNDHVWMVVFGYSPPWNIPSDKPRKRLMTALIKFIKLPSHKRGNEAWAIRTILQALDIVEIDIESRASMLLMSFWAYVIFQLII